MEESRCRDSQSDAQVTVIILWALSKMVKIFNKIIYIVCTELRFYDSNLKTKIFMKQLL